MALAWLWAIPPLACGLPCSRTGCGNEGFSENENPYLDFTLRATVICRPAGEHLVRSRRGPVRPRAGWNGNSDMDFRWAFCRWRTREYGNLERWAALWMDSHRRAFAGLPQRQI